MFDCGNGKGCIVVHVSNGSSFPSVQQWATNQGSYWTSQQWVVGDFNGDGRTDLAKAFNDGGKGSVDVHLSTGNNFSMQRWATKQGSFWDDQRWLAGDFNGDGFADVAKAFGESGKTSIDVHVSNGVAFSMQRWTTKQGSFWNGPQWVVGDFDGNGRSDVALLYSGTPEPWNFGVHLSSGSGFSPAANWHVNQSTQSPSHRWLAGDSTGDALSDLVLVVADGTPDGWVGLRPNIGGAFDGPPPTNPGMCPVVHYEGYVQCTFSMGGFSSFYVPDTLSQFAAPRLLLNGIFGSYDICTPIGAVPFSYIENVPCP